MNQFKYFKSERKLYLDVPEPDKYEHNFHSEFNREEVYKHSMEAYHSRLSYPVTDELDALLVDGQRLSENDFELELSYPTKLDSDMDTNEIYTATPVPDQTKTIPTQYCEGEDDIAFDFHQANDQTKPQDKEQPVKEDGEKFYQRNVQNPYPGDSQSHTAYDKGFEEGWEARKKVIKESSPQPTEQTNTVKQEDSLGRFEYDLEKGETKFIRNQDHDQLVKQDKPERKFSLQDMWAALFEGEVIGEERNVTNRNKLRQRFFKEKFNIDITNNQL